MQLHSLPKLKSKTAKRIGRGGRRGTTSGRGQKGQKSRAGHRIRPQERDLILRIPKRRGFKHNPVSEKSPIFNLDDLKKVGGTVSVATLKAKGMLSRRHQGPVKVLGRGEAPQGLVIGKDILLSMSARAKIMGAGGKVES